MLGRVVDPAQKSGRRRGNAAHIVDCLQFFIFLCFLLFFGLIGSIAFGSNFDKQLITEMLPADSIVVTIIKLCMIINVICSYGIYIFPCNTIIEGWIMKDK